MDDGRTPEHGYIISSPREPDGSGELMSNPQFFDLQTPHSHIFSSLTMFHRFPNALLISCRSDNNSPHHELGKQDSHDIMSNV